MAVHQKDTIEKLEDEIFLLVDRPRELVVMQVGGAVVVTYDNYAMIRLVIDETVYTRELEDPKVTDLDIQMVRGEARCFEHNVRLNGRWCLYSPVALTCRRAYSPRRLICQG